MIVEYLEIRFLRRMVKGLKWVNLCYIGISKISTRENNSEKLLKG
jgi:hypothetical protein